MSGGATVPPAGELAAILATTLPTAASDDERADFGRGLRLMANLAARVITMDTQDGAEPAKR